MPITDTTEKRFESDITAFLLSPTGGYTRVADIYDPKLGLFPDTLIRFIQNTQPKAWARFENANKVDPVGKFCAAFNNACDMYGLVHVLRHGFKHRGIAFRVCYFKPESSLNRTAAALYAQNEIGCNRQWFYSVETNKSVDMMLSVNGIPVFAFELKNQYTGQTVDNARRQWMYDRDPREVCFQFNKRILGFFAVDHTEVWMTTQLAGKDTYFLPFNQGSNGAGRDGGKGNPANPDGYPTAYLWEQVFRKDSMMDILQKFIHLQVTEEKKLISDAGESVSTEIMHTEENGESLFPIPDIASPIVLPDETAPGGTSTIWNAIAFGHYPQTEILDSIRRCPRRFPAHQRYRRGFHPFRGWLPYPSCGLAGDHPLQHLRRKP